MSTPTITLAEAQSNLTSAKSAYQRALAEPAAYGAGEISITHRTLGELAVEIARWQREVSRLSNAEGTSAMLVGRWVG